MADPDENKSLSAIIGAAAEEIQESGGFPLNFPKRKDPKVLDDRPVMNDQGQFIGVIRGGLGYDG